MNKTLTINLSGIVFHIDENAYDVFNSYIDSIRKHFASSEGKDEIMQDIEARIAEMFQQRVGESKQVITLRDVEEVTAAMGKPEQFGNKKPVVGKEVNKKFSSEHYSGFKGFLHRLMDALGELIGFILNVIAKIFALLFILVGLLVFGALLFALIMAAGVSAIKFPPVAIPALIAVLLLVGIPFLMLFYYGFRMLFNIKTKSKAVNMTAGGLWAMGLVIGILTAVFALRNYSKEGNSRQQLELIQPANDTLIVTMKNYISNADDEDVHIFKGWSFDNRDTMATITGPVKLDVRKSSSDKFELVKIVESHGSSRRDAAENAGGVRLAFAQTDNKLTLENHFQLSKNTTFAF